MAASNGLAKLQKRLAVIPKKVKAETKPALLKAANDMAATMKQLAPEDSGDLKASIHVTGPLERTPPYSQPGGSKTVPENAAVITVGDTTVRYPHLVEYGTAAAEAQPFFWPAVRLHRKKATAAIRRGIRKAIKDSA